MRLWTIQPPEVLKIIEETGRFICDKNKSTYYEDFQAAYAWMIKHMFKMKKPDDAELPIWAWYKWNWKNEEPSLTSGEIGVPGNKYVCIELEIPYEDIVLSDYNNWHCVLNDSFCNIAITEEEWERSEERYNLLDPGYQFLYKQLSWFSIFDITPFENEFCSNGKYVQAVFWEIKKENIISVKEFTAV